MKGDVLMAMLVPLHTQLRDALVEQITSGVLPPGSRVPSERELCRHYNVSRTTTRRTLSDLTHEGWVYTVVGKGTYVAQGRLEQELQPVTGFSDDLRQRGIDVSSQVLNARNIKAPDALASRLGLLSQAPIFQLERLRFASGTPLAIQLTSLPEHLCPGLLQFDFTIRSLYDVLRGEYGLRLLRGQTIIKADLSTPKEQQLLKTREQSAVLRTFQTTYLHDGQPIEYCQSTFHGDLYELTTSMGP